MQKTRSKLFTFYITTAIYSLLISAALISTTAFADGSEYFEFWLSALKTEAREAHISAKTIEETFKSAQYLPRVIVLDRGQPEFISPF